MRAYSIQSGSMEPTLQPGDKMFDTLGPNVRRGDIIVFTRPGGSERYDKRLIGLPGDHVACCDAQGRVTVNGHPLDETYIDRDGPPALAPFSVTLGPGQMWVLGDHRRDSLDSRGWGPVPTSGIIGYGSIVGHAFPTRILRTPQTFVTNALAPRDQRVAPSRIWGLPMILTGLVALFVLAVIGIIRFIVRRLRRRSPAVSGPGYQAPTAGGTA